MIHLRYYGTREYTVDLLFYFKFPVKLSPYVVPVILLQQEIYFCTVGTVPFKKTTFTSNVVRLIFGLLDATV